MPNIATNHAITYTYVNIGLDKSAIICSARTILQFLQGYSGLILPLLFESLVRKNPENHLHDFARKAKKKTLHAIFSCLNMLFALYNTLVP